MGINLSQRKLFVTGLVSVTLGAVLSISGGIRFGSRVDWWANRAMQSMNAIYEDRKLNSLEEVAKEREYIKNSGYMAVTGLIFLFGGAFISSVMRHRYYEFEKPTDYGESFYEGKNKSRK